MSTKLHLTLACGDYESIRALKEGAVQPDGIELTVLTDMDSSTRHWRMLRHRAFDVGELSCSSYLVAKDKGEGEDLTAIPVFLHRRFRHGFIFTVAMSTTTGSSSPAPICQMYARYERKKRDFIQENKYVHQTASHSRVW